MCIYTHIYVCIYESMCTYLLFIYIFKNRRKSLLGVSGAIKIALQEKPFWEASLKEQVWLLQFFHLIFICKYVNDTWKGNKESTGILEMNIRTSGFFFSLVFKYSLVLTWLNIVKLECMTSFLYLVIWLCLMLNWWWCSSDLKTCFPLWQAELFIGWAFEE